MRKWKRAWIMAMAIILCGGLLWTFTGSSGSNVNVTDVLPTPTITEKKLKIAVMADIHNDGYELGRLLMKAKISEVELVVVAGDLTNSGKREELKKIKEVLDNSGLRYAVVPGNHEYNLDLFLEYFGKNYQSIRYDDKKLILIDNSSWLGIEKVQKQWIIDEVSQCRELICIVIMHKPLNNVISTHIMGENNSKVALQAVWLKDLLISSGVKQMEAGHLHYASSYELEGLRTDIVGAVSRERNNQSSRYTELMIGKNSIERIVVVEDANDIGN